MSLTSTLTSLSKALEYQLTHILLTRNKITRIFEHQHRYGSSNALELRVRLPSDYPSGPPQIFLLSSILTNGTGGVDNGLLLLPSSFPCNWRKKRLCDLLKDAYDLVLRERGEVNLKTNCTCHLSTTINTTLSNQQTPRYIRRKSFRERV